MSGKSEIEASISALREVKGLISASLLIEQDEQAAYKAKAAIDKIDSVLLTLDELKLKGEPIDDSTKKGRDKVLGYFGWVIRIADLIARILDDD